MRFTLSFADGELVQSHFEDIVDVLNLWVRDDDFDGGLDTITRIVLFARNTQSELERSEAFAPKVRATVDKARHRVRVRFVSRVARPAYDEPPPYCDRPRVFFAPFAEEICVAVASMIPKRPKPGPFDAESLERRLRTHVGRLAGDDAAFAATLKEARAFAASRRAPPCRSGKLAPPPPLRQMSELTGRAFRARSGDLSTSTRLTSASIGRTASICGSAPRSPWCRRDRVV